MLLNDGTELLVVTIATHRAIVGATVARYGLSQRFVAGMTDLADLVIRFLPRFVLGDHFACSCHCHLPDRDMPLAAFASPASCKTLLARIGADIRLIPDRNPVCIRQRGGSVVTRWGVSIEDHAIAFKPHLHP